MQIKLIASPVIYTNNCGGKHAHELQAPSKGENCLDFPAGGPVQAAWYCPFDQINDLVAIHRIAVNPNGNSVRLSVTGLPKHRNARVRIRIYAAIG